MSAQRSTGVTSTFRSQNILKFFQIISLDVVFNSEIVLLATFQWLFDLFLRPSNPLVFAVSSWFLCAYSWLSHIKSVPTSNLFKTIFLLFIFPHTNSIYHLSYYYRIINCHVDGKMWQTSPTFIFSLFLFPF